MKNKYKTKFKTIFLKHKIKFKTILLLYYLYYISNYITNNNKNKFIIKKITKVSVILPIFNKENYLKRSIGSIQNQTLQNIEIVAINDCSTDNSLYILKKLAKKDIRIKIINNDRNHGPLYTRGMGIVNTSGEYIMSVDPDDRLEGIDNLELLYNKSQVTKADFVRFLLKRIPRNDSEIEQLNLIDKNQLISEDFLLTNKFIKRNIIFKAYTFFKKKIFSNHWRYHDDNIWNFLIRKYSKSEAILNKYIYIYKRNNESCMLNINTINEIRDRIYRFEMIQEINKDVDINQYIRFYMNIFAYSNYKSFSNYEIKKKLIRVSYRIMKISYNKYNNSIFDLVNYYTTKITDKKIIIFYSSSINNYEKSLTIISLFNFLKYLTKKKFLFININNNNDFNNIVNFIFPNDILVLLDEAYSKANFLQILKNYNKNKIIVLFQNNNIKININSIMPKYMKIYTFNNNSYQILKQLKNQSQIFFFPGFIKSLSNYFNLKFSQKKYNMSIIIKNNNNTHKYIKNIISKYYNIEQVHCLQNLQKKDLIKLIKESNIILTDSYDVMKLSALFFTSCIILESNKKINIQIQLINELNYIKYIFDINQLEEIIIYFKYKLNINKIKEKIKYFDLFKKEFQ